MILALNPDIPSRTKLKEDCSMEKWQEQVEEIVRKKFPDGDSSELVKEATKVIDMAYSLDPPSGELGKVFAELMKQASEDLPPLAGVYLGFQFGMAWERLHAR